MRERYLYNVEIIFTPPSSSTLSPGLVAALYHQHSRVSQLYQKGYQEARGRGGESTQREWIFRERGGYEAHGGSVQPARVVEQ